MQPFFSLLLFISGPLSNIEVDESGARTELLPASANTTKQP